MTSESSPIGFAGRGMRSNRYDVWMLPLGPSERRFRAFLDGKLTWAACAREFGREMFPDGPLNSRRPVMSHESAERP